MAKETRKVHISVTSNASKDLNKGTVAAKGLSGSLKGVATSANLATGGIRAMTMALLSSGVGALVVGLGALVAGFGTVINKSSEFSKEMSNLKAIIGADKDDSIFEALAKDAKRLGASTAFTATQVVQLQTEFAKLGFTTNEIIGATEATLNLAAATKTDLATAAAVAGGTMRGFGMLAEETTRITDVMALSFSSSTLDISKFQESMKYVAPVAKLMKVSIEEATGALGILADNQISGSMAGTNLRKIIGDLTKATGKGFRESLEIVSEKLANATSESEKLAIAQKLVGDRAYGALTILAENTKELDELTHKLDTSAEGYAKLAAEAQLDNLAGDVTKLGSAWEGFILSLEDGNGIMSKISRGAVKILTLAVQGLGEGFRTISRDFALIGVGFNQGANWFKSLGAELDMLGVQFDTFAIDALLSLADVPFVGGVVDKEVLLAERTQLKSRHDAALEEQKKFRDRALELDKEADKIQLDYILNEAKVKSDEEARVIKSVMGEFREGEQSEDEKQAKKDLDAKKEFLAKLKKLEQDTDDTTALEKIQRKRERHLEELKQVVKDKTELKQAEATINAIYDQQREAQIKINNDKKKKIFDDFTKQFGIESEDPSEKLAQQREAHLAEVEQLKIDETEKEEARKAIKAYYANEEATLKANDRALKQEQDLADLETKKQLISQGLDLAIEASGQESKIGQALFKIKQMMALAEMAMQMKTYMVEMKMNAQKAEGKLSMDAVNQTGALSEGMANAAKLGPPFNAIPMAIMAIQSGLMIKNMMKSKKEMKKITGRFGGGGIGGGATAPQAPNFNVIGQTSAGENLIADTIQGANSRPIRAFVVDKDVTSSQELARNTENIASIG
jgi:TP901 family phage tail tape measure protein